MSPVIPHAVLEEIRSANDIVTVIGSYFTLQRRGATFKALCPFHKEKTPSFIVNQSRQIYHCFGCGAGGDVFRFVMEYEKVDFMTAVKILAQRAGIHLAWEDRPADGRPDKNSLYELNQKVAALYQQILWKSPGAEIARRYLARRDLPQSAAEEFLIGYAPDRWDTLLEWAGKKFTRDQLAAAGLIVPATDADGNPSVPPRWYDRFRKRLMFPVQDEQGRVLGFSGRILTADADTAKYVNSPETVLFHKGRILYALRKARQAIVENREAIVCEGQIDVIRCHLAGFNTAVAAQGTAFTDDHARILKRYADSVALVFDADRAGQDAALRAAETFLQVGLAVRIAALPAGEDPDSLLRKPGGPEAFRQILENARAAIDFQIDVLRARETKGTEAGLMRIAAAVLATISRAPNAVQQTQLLRQAAAQLGLPEEALRRDLQKLERPTRVESGPAKSMAPAPVRPARELALVEQVAAEPTLAQLVRVYLPLALINDPDCRKLMAIILEAAQNQREIMSVVAEQDDPGRTVAQFAAQVLAAPPKVTGALMTGAESVQSLILGLWTNALQRRRRTIQKTLQAARAAPVSDLTADALNSLQAEYNEHTYDLARLKTWEAAVPIIEQLIHSKTLISD